MRSKAIVLALLALAFTVQAVPVSERQARLAARAWAEAGGRFGARLGSSVESLRTFSLTNGAAFFSAKMSGGGAIILSADSEDEPVVAMSSADISNPEPGSPLYALLEKDLAARKAAREAADPAAAAVKAREAFRRWQRLMRAGEAIDMAGDGRVPPEQTAPTDLRVDALVKSKWDQEGHGENLYTPNRYVCGCVATAMAQIMRYWSFPVAEVPVFSNSGCAVDGVRTPMTAMGGVYDWANMPLEPFNASRVEREAIGRLTYDCGVSVAMDWGKEGSGAFTEVVGDALKSVFHYASAERSKNTTGLSTDESVREKTIYASLDAGSPVQLGINHGGKDGHSIVADGYGYIDGVSYVHLNMGWSGAGDVWYHLPDITYVATSTGWEYDADTIQVCIYNIFPQTTGVVLSGRTLSDEGEVVANAAVSVFRTGETEPITNLTSSAYGVYAAILPAGDYTVSATDGYLSGEAEFTLADENVWGCEVILSRPSVRVISADFATTNVCSSLDWALRLAANMETPTLEIFEDTILKATVAITNQCRIVAGPELPGYATVNRRGTPPASLVVSGTTVFFDGILFSSASSTPVTTVNGGVAAFSGLTSVSETLSVEVGGPGGFALTGDIAGGIAVLAPGAMAEGDVFGIALCPFDTAAANAAKIINPEDPELGGEAFVDPDTGDVLLRWAQVAVDPTAAIASWRDEAGTWHYVRSFDSALSPSATEVVLSRSSKMKTVFRPVQDVSFSAENGATLTGVSGAQFLVDTVGVTVSFANFTVAGFTGNDAFVVVKGGTVELGAGAVFSNLSVRNGIRVGDVAYRYGPFVVKSGKLVMLSGSAISDCRALSDNSNETGGYGGGVYVYSGAEFDMRGGTISGCYAEVAGGGVYADSGSIVRLSGDATISGNTACVGKNGSVAEDDLRRMHSASILVDGALTGRVGIVDVTGKWNNADGEAFAVADGASAAEMAASSAAFFCTAPLDANMSRRAVLSAGGDSIEWDVEDLGDGPFPVDPSVAVARVTRAGEAADYWATLADAFHSVKGVSATIELLDDEALAEDIEVSGVVTLRTAPEYIGGYAIAARSNPCRIRVGAGSSLTVEGVDFHGNLTPGDGKVYGRLFDVDGGTLTLSDSEVSFVVADEDRASAAIVAYNGATVAVTDGSRIAFCENGFDDPDVNAGAAGGIIVEDAGTTLILRDCSVRNCYARKTGGVFIGNKAQVRISGAVFVEDNACFDEGSCGNMTIAEGASLVLEGELTGFVGCAEGVRGDQIVFGTVEGGASAAVVASAANFVHDVTRARGSVVGTDLVWDLAGRTVVAKPVALGTLFTYDRTTHVAIAAGAGYSLTGVQAVDAGTYHAVARLAPGCVWDDGTTDVVSFDWTVEKVPLTVIAGDASKTEGEEDPDFTHNYTVEGIVPGDSQNSVIALLLTRDPGEEPGTYLIKIYASRLLSDNYSFDKNTSFTYGVFTINPDDSGILPDVPDDASLEEILAALESSGVTDPRVANAVSAYYAADPDGAIEAYRSFSSWAKNTVGDAAAVCASETAWVSYEFGVDELFENVPTVTITSMSIEDPAEAAMRVTVSVKDGTVEKDVDPDSVAKLFEMSTDLKNWSQDLTAEANDDGSFTVKPLDPSLPMAVIRLRY